jgi:hypothetical protein
MTTAVDLSLLANPDATGQNLALYRTRAYRFTDDLRHPVLADVLEERHIHHRAPAAETLAYVQSCLDAVRTAGRLPDFAPAIPHAEQIDVTAELARRRSASPPARETQPELVVAIVGAPRSGTSHQFNLLARHASFAYFTTVSCWAWPTYNLARPGRRLYAQLNAEEINAVLSVDNKNTRLLPALVMPYEGEDIYARALPVYRHLRGHHYELHQHTRSGDAGILTRAVSEHLSHFGAKRFLTKSPFNSLRIPQLELLWGDRARYIHVQRNQAEAADSMRRNQFTFSKDGKTLTEEDAWAMFTETVAQDMPGERSLTIHHHDLITDPQRMAYRLLTWAIKRGRLDR